MEILLIELHCGSILENVYKQYILSCVGKVLRSWECAKVTIINENSWLFKFKVNTSGMHERYQPSLNQRNKSFYREFIAQ